MATIKKMNNGVRLEDGESIYIFPFNTIILTSNENSNSINFKLDGCKKTFKSINFNSFTYPIADNAEDFCKECEKIIYNL